MLQEDDGSRSAATARKSTYDIPILMLTARG